MHLRELAKQQHLWQVEPFSDTFIKSNIFKEILSEIREARLEKAN